MANYMVLLLSPIPGYICKELFESLDCPLLLHYGQFDVFLLCSSILLLHCVCLLQPAPELREYDLLAINFDWIAVLYFLMANLLNSKSFLQL